MLADRIAPQDAPQESGRPQRQLRTDSRAIHVTQR